MIEREALEQQGQQLVRRATDLKVVDERTFTAAADDVKLIKAYVSRVAEVFDPIVESAHRAHKVAVDQRKKLLAPAQEAETILKRGMAGYQQEIERQRREAEEAERRERERLEAEARAVAEAEQARLLKEAEDAAIEAAAEAEQQGDTQTAERILAAPIIAPTVAPMPVFTAPTMTRPAPQVAGVSFRDQFGAELESLDALIRAAAGGNSAAKSLLMFNQTAANGLARSTRGTLVVPGVRFTAGKTTAVRI